MDLSLPDERLAATSKRSLPASAGRCAEQVQGRAVQPDLPDRGRSGRYVLRRKPPGQLLRFRARGRPRVPRAAGAARRPVPVAAPLHLCRDESVIGSMFY
jgi:aminoglycoside phosphotransferase (APT) family kinase protein